MSTTDTEADGVDEYGIDWSKCPRHATSYKRHVYRGGHVGGFLTAVLEDSLSDAVGRADSTNAELLREHVVFVYNQLPQGCWGSPEEVAEWRDDGGLEGRE